MLRLGLKRSMQQQAAGEKREEEGRPNDDSSEAKTINRAASLISRAIVDKKLLNRPTLDTPSIIVND